MISFTNEALLAYLKEEKKLPAELQSETGQVYYVYKSKMGDIPIFLRIYENQTQLQIITFLTLPIPADQVDTISRVLHLLNKEVDMPAFGLDEEIGLVFHRIMIPVFGPHLGSKVLDLYLDAIPGLAEHIFPLIQKIASSQMKFEDIKKNLKEAASE